MEVETTIEDKQGYAKALSITEDHTIIQTTLYDLIEAVNETVKPDDDLFVTGIVMDMLNADHVKFQNSCQ